MKKIILILCIIFQLVIPVYAEYKPIPESLSEQYKTEIEQIIDEEYPQVIKKIDDEVNYAKSLRDKILKNGFNFEDYIALSLIPDTCIPAADLDLYGKMLKITKEKYLDMEYISMGTDSVNPIDEILTPYFRDNNVNRKKLEKIIIYEDKKIEIVEKYIKEVEKLRPASN